MAGQFDEFYLPFDSTGTAVTNQITDVRHTIASVGNHDYQQIAPRYGLFFGKDLVIKHAESNTVLEEGTDYYLSYYARWFKQKFNEDAFGSIVILNKNITGNIGISARYVGGDFARPLDGLIPTLISELETANVVFWDQIIDPPTEYNPTSHTVSTDELTSGFDDMVEVLWAINDSIIQLGEIPNPIDMSLVTGLEDALLRKQDNNVYSQLNKGFLKLSDPDYVSITLPIPEAAGLWTIDISLNAPAGKSSVEGNPLIAGDAIKISILGQIEPTASLATWQNAYAFVRNSVKVIPIYLEYTTSNAPIIYLDVRELFSNKELVEFDSGTYIKEATINVDRITFTNTNPDKLGLFDTPFLIEQLTTLTVITAPVITYLDNSHKHTPEDVGALPAIGGAVPIDFWREEGTRKYNGIFVLGSAADAKPSLVILAKKYIDTALDKTGFVGRILYDRGTAGSTLQSDFVDLAVSSAYTQNSINLLYRSGNTVASAKIVEVTYNDETHYALYRPSSSYATVVAEGSTFSDGYPVLIPDSTSYTMTDVATTDALYHVNNKPTSYVGETAPVDAKPGSSWYCTKNGLTYILLDDGNSIQWVESNPNYPAAIGTFTPEDIGAAPENHTHTPESIGAVPLDGSVAMTGTLMAPMVQVEAEPVNDVDLVNKRYADALSGGSSTYVGETPPTGVKPGSSWYCTKNGLTYTLLDDGNSIQWVESNPNYPAATGFFTPVDIGAAPVDHIHEIADVTNLQTTLDGKAPLSHTHVIDDVEGLREELDELGTPPYDGIRDGVITTAPTENAVFDALAGKSPTNHSHTPASIGAATEDHTHTAAEIGAAPVSHTHTPADIGAAPVDHIHEIADVTNLQTTLDGKSPTGHTHTPESIGTVPGTLPIPIVLSAVSLNTVIKPGHYIQPYSADATLAYGYPEDFSSGSLIVKGGGEIDPTVLGETGVQQEYHVTNTTRVYVRASTSSPAPYEWTEWVLMYNRQNKPTASEVGAIPLDGSVGMTGTLTTPDVYITSDRRLKSEFAEITDALNKVYTLHGQTYLKRGIRDVGIIAQDLQKILPEAVYEDKDTYLSISSSGVIALLVEAIKELKDDVDELKARNGEF